MAIRKKATPAPTRTIMDEVEEKSKKRPSYYAPNDELMKEIAASKKILDEKTEEFPDDNITPAECLTPRLVQMLMMIVYNYSQKNNWRNYCVDEQTECLTKRGWLDIDDLTTEDVILSYLEGKLIWSRIESIFRNDFEGNMFHLSVQGMDALVTPRHKFVTQDGLKKVEYLRERDKIIMLGEATESPESIYDDEFVELVGWAVTEGSYYESDDRNYTRMSISQKRGLFANRIRKCLKNFGSFGEGKKDMIVFTLSKDLCGRIEKVAPNRVLSMPFILSLTQHQREILIDTMVNGDGWITYGKHSNYCQVDKEHVDAFLALCTIAGKQTSVRVREPSSYGKEPYYSLRIFSRKSKRSIVENIDFHGGKTPRNKIGESKESYPNMPTIPYKGRVWCPKTEFGSFVARRKGYIYLTGNTYIDDMRGDAILSLCQNALKFNPEKSKNPFGYYTQIVTHSFLTFLEKEKKMRRIRDDILEQNMLNPSHARQLENEERAREHWNQLHHVDQRGNTDGHPPNK